MNSAVSIRLLEQNEMPLILSLVQLLNPDLDMSILENRLNKMIQKGYLCAGLFYDNELAGICGLWHLEKFYAGTHIEPDNVIIDPRYRGMGLGKRLFEWIDDYAAKNACETIELNCYVGNSAAHRFWMNEGYKILGFHFQKKLHGE